MKKLYLSLSILLSFFSCTKESVESCPSAADSLYLVTPGLESRLSDTGSPLSGILEAYPCKAGTSIFYGNYYNGQLMPFYGFYHIQDGSIFGTNNRVISLPVGQYNMVYWATPQYEEPIHSTPAIEEPGVSMNADLSKLYFKLRKYPSDTTYIPVYDMAQAVKEVTIGNEDLQVHVRRVVAGLKVIVKMKDNGVISSSVEDIKVHIHGIAERMNLYTAQADNFTKTVSFGLVRSVDNTEMSNAMVMLFPSSSKPEIRFFITLKDGSVHTLSRSLSSTLEANTRLTLWAVLGDIFSEGGSRSFTIDNWQEASETIEFPVIE